MNNLIRISDSLSVNGTSLSALYVSASGKLVAEIANDNVDALVPIKHITWDVLNDICIRHTQNTLGVPHRIIDLMALQGFMTEGEESRLKKSIEESLSSNTFLVYFGDSPSGNAIPMIPTVGEFLRVFSNRSSVDEDELLELVMELDAVNGVELERTTSDLKVIVSTNRMNFPILTFSLDDGEATVYFDVDPPLYQASPAGQKVISEYLNDLIYEFDANLLDGIVTINPFILTNLKEQIANNIKTVISKLSNI